MNTSTRALVLSMLALVLAACGSVPKKGALPQVGGKHVPPAPVATTWPTEPVPAGCKGSPYAKAQEDAAKRGNYTAGGLYAPGVRDSVSGISIDVACIPEPLVTDEPHSSYGNRSPYAVLDKQYTVLDSARGYDETGTASYYGSKFHGRLTSNREVYDMYAYTAAHKTLPLPSFARVTNLDSGESVIVRVNDRGPFHDDRLIDLSYAAAVRLGIALNGTGRVEVKGLTPEDMLTDGKLTGAVARNDRRPAAMAPVAGKTAETSRIDRLVADLPAKSGTAATARQARTTAPVADAGIRAAAAPTTTAVAALPENERWRYRASAKPGGPVSADAFDAWMRERGVHVATGKPSVPTAASAPSAVAANAVLPAEAAAPHPIAPAPIPAAAPGVAEGLVGDLMLQVASFASRENADRALGRLSAAGIAGATLSDIQSGGRTMWRLRVRSAQPDFTELAGRIARLGFGMPKPVRE